MEIRIKEKNYRFRQTVRSMFIFEQIMSKPFEIKTLLDNYVFLYSIILANNPDDGLTWDEFLDALDSDPDILVKMNEMIERGSKIEDVFNDDADAGEDEKKN